MKKVLKTIFAATPQPVLFLATLVIALAPALLAFSPVEYAAQYGDEKSYDLVLLSYICVGLGLWPMTVFNVLHRANWR